VVEDGVLEVTGECQSGVATARGACGRAGCLRRRTVTWTSRTAGGEAAAVGAAWDERHLIQADQDCCCGYCSLLCCAARRAASGRRLADAVLLAVWLQVSGGGALNLQQPRSG